MKIVHLSTVHSPFDTRIFQRQCRSLAEAGHEVVFIVPHEKDELVDGVQIRALPKPSSRYDRMSRTLWRIYRQACRERGDVYHFHDPELIGVGLLLRLGAKHVIYDVHEDVPRDIMTKEYLPALVRRIVSPLSALVEGIAAACLSGIVVVTPTISARFPTSKTVLVQNFPKLDELVLAEPTPYSQRPMQAVYVGGIGAVRGIREMVDAMMIMEPDLQARLALAGLFSPPDLEATIKQLPGWRHVDALGFQTRPQVAKLLSQSRAGLVLYLPGPTHDDAQPNKLFEYMSAGIPVIASNFPRWREIVSGAECGLLVPPTEPAKVAEALTWLLTHPQEAEAMGKRGQQAVAAQYNWGVEFAKLLALYRKFEK